MKVLFLDVDGVLNYAGCIYRVKGTNMLGVDPKQVAMVRRIIRDTGCKVVLSSSWRLYKPDREYIKKKIDFIDITPDHRGTTDRGCEIIAWLAATKEIVEVHAILDDSSDFHKGQPLFRTSWDKGLTPEITQQVIDHLNEKNKNEPAQTRQA